MKSLARHLMCVFLKGSMPVLVMLGLSLCGPSIVAQSSSSGVNGVVTDSSGAVISGARVALKNADTNVERDTVSNGTGDYFFGNLPPARYVLTIAAANFQTQKVSAFNVAVAQVVTVNATLRLGDVQQSITVEAVNTQVESTSAQLGSAIGTHAVSDLPLNGRNFTQLLDLTPGVTPLNTSQNSGGSFTPAVASSSFSFPSINGAFNRSTIYLVDGMNDNQTTFNAYAVPPIVDTIQEFKINSHGGAEYGGVLGGVVNVATKSGTNAYHGDAWDFVRSNGFDANPYFSAPPSYHLNTFGGQMGGPVRVPRLYNGKDRTFFEIGFEGTKYSKAGASNILIPTAAQLGETTFGGAQNLQYADFSSASTGVGASTPGTACVAGATTASTNPCQLYDPTFANSAATPNRPAYLGNQVPVSEFKASQMAYIKAVFGTKGPIVIPGISPTIANYQITDPTRQSTYNYTARIDEHIGTRDFIFLRFAEIQARQTAPGSLPTLYSISTSPAQQYGVSWNHVFSPTTSVQVQYGRVHIGLGGETLFNNHSLWQTYGCSTDLCDDYVGGVAVLAAQNVTGGFGGGESNGPTPDATNTHEYSGSIMRIMGNHQIQAGGGWDGDNIKAMTRTATIGFNGGSTANFSGNPGAPAGITSKQISAQGGFGLVDFLLDYPNNENKRNVLQTERIGGIGSIYLQDVWKLNSSLTLTYGIRYDRTVIPPYGTNASIGLQGSIETGDFDFTTGNYIVQVLPPLCSVRGHAPCLPSATLPAHVVVAQSGKIMHGSKANFGPRFGFAYRVNDGLSVRGGFGIVYDNWSAVTQMAENWQGSWPDTGTLQINNTNTPGTPYTSAQDPFVDNVANLPAATPFGPSNVGYMVSPYWKNPYSEQYNLGIEKSTWFKSILSLNYVGSASHRMDIGGYYNTGTPAVAASFAARQAAGTTGQPFPYTVPQKSWDHAAGDASYNALQASFNRSFASGVGYGVAYTWDKVLTDAQDGFFGSEGGVAEDPYNPKGSRGPAGFSVPQMLAVHYVYALPFGTGKKFSTGNRLADYAIGNWQTNGIFTARSGQAFSIMAGGDIANTGSGSTYERANQVGNPYQSGPIAANPTCTPPAGGVHTRTQWFNPCAFQAPAVGTLGTVARNTMRGPNFWDFDTSVFRQFPIHDEISLSLNAEAFNALNHPVLGNPGNTVTSSSSFGVITGTASQNRILQFSAKLFF